MPGEDGLVATAIKTLDGGLVNLADAEIDAFRTALRDGVVTPGQSGFTDKPIFNAMHQRRPARIARCAGTADVVAAVKFARQHGLLVDVRGGGHSVAGHSSCDGGLVIDPDNFFRLNPNLMPAPTVAA